MKIHLLIPVLLISLSSIGQINTKTNLDSCFHYIDTALTNYTATSIRKLNTHIQLLLQQKKELIHESEHYFDSKIDYQLSLFKTGNINQQSVKKTLYPLITERHQYLSNINELLYPSDKFILANHHKKNYNDMLTLMTVMDELTKLKQIKANLYLHK